MPSNPQESADILRRMSGGAPSGGGSLAEAAALAKQQRRTPALRSLEELEPLDMATEMWDPSDPAWAGSGNEPALQAREDRPASELLREAVDALAHASQFIPPEDAMDFDSLLSIPDRAKALGETISTDPRSPTKQLTDITDSLGMLTGAGALIPTPASPVLAGLTGALEAPGIARRFFAPEGGETRMGALGQAALTAIPGALGAARIGKMGVDAVDAANTASQARRAAGRVSTEIPYHSTQTPFNYQDAVGMTNEVMSETGQDVHQALRGLRRAGGYGPQEAAAVESQVLGGRAARAGRAGRQSQSYDHLGPQEALPYGHGTRNPMIRDVDQGIIERRMIDRSGGVNSIPRGMRASDWLGTF